MFYSTLDAHTKYNKMMYHVCHIKLRKHCKQQKTSYVPLRSWYRHKKVPNLLASHSFFQVKEESTFLIDVTLMNRL